MSGADEPVTPEAFVRELLNHAWRLGVFEPPPAGQPLRCWGAGELVELANMAEAWAVQSARGVTVQQLNDAKREYQWRLKPTIAGRCSDCAELRHFGDRAECRLLDIAIARTDTSRCPLYEQRRARGAGDVLEIPRFLRRGDD